MPSILYRSYVTNEHSDATDRSLNVEPVLDRRTVVGAGQGATSFKHREIRLCCL
jgi:hypothetical protein